MLGFIVPQQHAFPHIFLCNKKVHQFQWKCWNAEAQTKYDVLSTKLEHSLKGLNEEMA